LLHSALGLQDMLFAQHYAYLMKCIKNDKSIIHRDSLGRGDLLFGRRAQIFENVWGRGGGRYIHHDLTPMLHADSKAVIPMYYINQVLPFQVLPFSSTTFLLLPACSFWFLELA